MAEQQKKTRVLAWGDYGCTTGFGTVMSNIMRELHATGKYQIDVLGINFTGDPLDPVKWPGTVIPALTAQEMMAGQSDVYGRQKLLNLMAQIPYDLVFLLNDTFILQQGGRDRSMIGAMRDTINRLPKKTKIIYYYPLDFRPKPHWINDVIPQVDYAIPYTEYARRETTEALTEPLPNPLQVIYHGTNLADFHYVQDRALVQQFREKFFGEAAKGKFVLMNLNRNQLRKDIARSLMVVKQLKDRGRKDILLYIHAQNTDNHGTLSEVANQLGLEINKDYMIPSPEVFLAAVGLPVSELNMIYNAADAVITTTLGEGWGLSITEAFATKTPVIAPDNTSITEILGEGERGYLADSGNTPSLWAMHGAQDNELLRPLTDVDSMANCIEDCIDYPVAREKKVDSAYAWVQKLSWKHVVEQWVPIFDKAASEVQTATAPNRAQRRRLEREKKHKALAG